MTIHRMPARRCPHCFKLLDASAALEAMGQDRAPEPGDITLCLGCGTALEFRPDGFHILTLLEFAALPADTQAQLERAKALSRKMAAWSAAERN